MKLLIVTQKVDKTDPFLGFFHKWIEEFATHFEAITVVCLYEGQHSLPPNVRVFSLGKERGASKLGYIARFYRLITRERHAYDRVFVHMNPIYVVLAGWLWHSMGKKVTMWYTHKQVDTKLKIAAKYTDMIFTASQESFQLQSASVMVTGHGIEVEKFAEMSRTKVLGSEPLRIAVVGRITPIKGIITMIEAAHVLVEKWAKQFEIVFIGDAVNAADEQYKKKCLDLAETYNLGDKIQFVGSISAEGIATVYAAADATVNLTPTGGVDKVVLESMAAGVPAFSSNEAFKAYFGDMTSQLYFTEKNAEELAGKIMDLFNTGNPAVVGAALQKVVRERSDVTALVTRLSETIQILA